MKARTKRWLKMARFVAYPVFYLMCLAVFGYLSFPWDQLKDRVISEFNRSQARSARPGEPAMRLEIDELDSYWFTGIEIQGARLTIPPKPKKSSSKSALAAFGGGGGDEEEAPKASVVHLQTVTARARFWSLLTGDVVVDFEAEAFGGQIEGTVPIGESGDDVNIEFSALQLLEIEPLQAVLEGVPLQGVAEGKLSLTPKEGKFAKSDGTASIALSGIKLGKPRKNDAGEMEDVVEIQGISVPSVIVGPVNIEAIAKDGSLAVAQVTSKSADFELDFEGDIKLNDVWDRSRAEMFLKFKFTDEYRTKSPLATTLLGAPDSPMKPIIEMSSDIKRAKTTDGFYRFRISGALSKLDFDPAPTAGKPVPGSAARPTPTPRPAARRRVTSAKKPKPTPRMNLATPRPTPNPDPVDDTPPPMDDPPVAEDPPPDDPPEEHIDGADEPSGEEGAGGG